MNRKNTNIIFLFLLLCPSLWEFSDISWLLEKLKGEMTKRQIILYPVNPTKVTAKSFSLRHIAVTMHLKGRSGQNFSKSDPASLTSWRTL